MNILPKSSKEFARKEYWDQFFTKRTNSFEWYGEYSDLKSVLLKYLKAPDELLIVGCGNSSLSADLYDDGYRSNTSIDISEVAIKKMISKYKCNGLRPEMVFEVMDIFKMKYDDEQFNAVLDKGTLDALSSDLNLDIEAMFTEIGRVLKPLGRYICVSLLQEAVLRKLLGHFTCSGSWIVRIHRCTVAAKSAEEADHHQHSDSVNMPVFVVVCTKLKCSLPAASLRVDIDIQGSGTTFHKCADVGEAHSIIDAAQKFECLKYYVRNNKIDDEDFHVELFGDQESTDSRYRLYATAKATVASARCAVFIVPQGREHEWLFSTNKGRENLLKQCQVERLIVVHLSRRHRFDSLDAIKEELAGQITDFFPRSAKRISFLSLGDDIGERRVLYQARSDFSGEYIVEEVVLSEGKFRRLVFLSNRNVIQSEAKLKTVQKNSKSSSKKGGKHEVIDNAFLSCEHHKTIAASLTMLQKQQPKSAAKHRQRLSLVLIGLGGGCFVNFLLHNLTPSLPLDITVVEIDPAMIDIATKWFDFGNKSSGGSGSNPNSYLNIHIDVVVEDGLRFLEKEAASAKRHFDFIIFDVDSKNLDLGVSCPPAEFLETAFLQQAVFRCLSPQGLFILNLVARNEEAKGAIYDRLRSLFAQCLLWPVEEDLNEIVVCSKLDSSDGFTWPVLKDAQQRLALMHRSPLYMAALEGTYSSLAGARPKLL